MSTSSPPPNPFLPLRPLSPSNLGATRIDPIVASRLHAFRDTLDARVSSPERARTSWADASGSVAKKVAGKQDFTISSGLAEILGPSPLECEGVGCRAVATTLPPPRHTKAVYSDMMREGLERVPHPANAVQELQAAEAAAVQALHETRSTPAISSNNHLSNSPLCASEPPPHSAVTATEHPTHPSHSTPHTRSA
jgi:hypothetical protein